MPSQKTYGITILFEHAIYKTNEISIENKCLRRAAIGRVFCWDNVFSNAWGACATRVPMFEVRFKNNGFAKVRFNKDTSNGL